MTTKPNEAPIEWMSLTQAAELFGVSRRYMKLLVIEEKIPVMHLKHHIKLDKRLIEELFAKRYHPVEEGE